MNDVKDHILSFPNYESHYCRERTSKKYLSSDLSITKMYDMYKTSRTKPVSRKCFHELNLSFKKPKQDTCNACDELNANDDSRPSLQHDLAAAYETKGRLNI